MSFVERLTKKHKSSRKEPRASKNLLLNSGQQKTAEKLQVKFSEFQKHHSDLKDMLKFFDSSKDTFSTSQQKKEGPQERNRSKEKDTMRQSTKQNIRNKTKVDEPIRNSYAMIKYKSKLDGLESDSENNFAFLMKNLKNGAKKQGTKTEATQNPEESRKLRLVQRANVSDKTKKNEISCSEKRGLENRGNTCYMQNYYYTRNSVLQCLFHFSDFSENLQQALFSIQQNQVERATVITKYLQLYDGVIKNKQFTKQLSTLPLKSSVSKVCSMFIDFSQEDAHQFLRQMLDTMHQQINIVQSPPKYKAFSFSLFTDNLATVVQQYQKFLKRYDDSFIYDAFSGEMCSFVTCSNCGKQSLTLQYFLDISLPMIKGIKSLQKLIEAYFNQESLWDYYSCDACKSKSRNSIKRIDLWDPPNYFIVNLKRSQFGKKNIDPITLPTKLLNMKKFMKNRTDKVQKSGIYRLMGITHHRGVIDGGHYWASVRSSNSWYTIDDMDVKKHESNHFEKQLETEGSNTAYLLFYQLI